MSPVTKSARVCETCGSPIDTTSAGDLGCIACLIGTGLDAEAEQSDTTFASAPDQLGAYTIEHHADGSAWELGHGAMGVTYRAIDKALDRPVALKIINTDRGSHSAEARERFMREARAAAASAASERGDRVPIRRSRGNRPILLRYGIGRGRNARRTRSPFGTARCSHNDRHRAASDRGVGSSGRTRPGASRFKARQSDAGPRKTGALWRIRRDYNAPLAVAVRRTSQRDRPLPCKVIDFGVAKAVAEKTNAMALTHGGFVGTPAFASPEQFTNAPVDVRSDIYSLGVTLWFLLTGHMLFSGRTIEEIQEARQIKAVANRPTQSCARSASFHFIADIDASD